MGTVTRVNDFKQCKKCEYDNKMSILHFEWGTILKDKVNEQSTEKCTHARMQRGSWGGGVPPPPFFEKFNHLNLHSKIPLKKDLPPPSPPKKKEKIIPLIYIYNNIMYIFDILELTIYEDACIETLVSQTVALFLRTFLNIIFHL